MKLRLTERPDAILREVVQLCPAANEALRRSATIPGQLLPYQAAALYMLACRTRGYILDIGTFKGYSASILAQTGRPVITLNPAWREAVAAASNLAPWRNVAVLGVPSWDYLAQCQGSRFGLVFVDGDHKRALRDAAWFDRLSVGGLILFHDVETAGVAKAVDALGVKLGRAPDVAITDTDGVSMAGYCRRRGELWQ